MPPGIIQKKGEFTVIQRKFRIIIYFFWGSYYILCPSTGKSKFFTISNCWSSSAGSILITNLFLETTSFIGYQLFICSISIKRMILINCLIKIFLFLKFLYYLSFLFRKLFFDKKILISIIGGINMDIYHEDFM